MRARWLLVPLVLVLLLGSFPARADIVPIDPPDDDIAYENLLDDAELSKIQQLQDSTITAVVSPVSPDDQVVMTGYLRPGDDEPVFAFLDMTTGVTTTIEPFLGRYLPFSNLSWYDNDTIVFVALEIFFPVMVGIDRTTGEVFTFTRLFDVPGFPVSLSPNGTRLLVVVPPDDDDAFNAEQPFAYNPFDVAIPLRPERAQPPNPTDWFSLFQDDDASVAASSTDLTLAYFNINTRETVDLVQVPEDTILLGEPAWSQDGSQLALARTSVTFGARGEVSLAETVIQDTLGNLPPAENPLLQNNLVDVFNLANPEPIVQQLRAPEQGLDLLTSLSWSTDNRTLLTQMRRPGQLAGRNFPTYIYPESSYIRFYDAASLQVTGVLDAPELNAPNFSFPVFVSPGEVIISAVSGLSVHFFYYNRDSGEFRRITSVPGFYAQWAATRLSQQLVFVHSSFLNPPEIYRLNWDGGGLTALTAENARLRELNQVQVHELSFTLASGAVRSGYLVQPAGAPFPPQNAPVVVWQEGGPGLFMINLWAANVERPFNLLPNFGLSVLVFPLPGREGWGPDFYKGLYEDRNFGAADIDEAAEIVRQMIDLGYTSADRVGITGCSYGGYFTAQSIARHPDIYAAANPQCTLFDVITEWQTGFTALTSFMMGRPPSADPTEYVNDSPIFSTGQVRTPTLLFHGSDDFLPVAIAETYQQELESRGVPVRLLRFEEAGHGLGSAEHQLIAAQEQISWFRRYLGGTPAAPEPPAEVVQVAAPPVAPAAPPPAPTERLRGMFERSR